MMTLGFDPTADFATIVDRTEDVVLTRSESLVTIAITGALTTSRYNWPRRRR